ncbi:arylsulfatase [Aquimarina agarilytica]|uniref:arylsulfatase n=1 Tax=Aquimarina agarilytica TaxID=1087449 RepID=UPI000288F65C|nr:arylsulfatase [Aquimarina agarilytica]
MKILGIKNIKVIMLFLLGLTSCKNKVTPSEKLTQDKIKKPNIIYILADDLGYGDLSSYGQQKFKTPNIDKLVAEGMKFTQHYTGSAVCAPSRSSLLTGLHTGNTPIRGNKELKTEGQVALPAESLTFAEVLQEAGYVTGAFGKWGLGFIGSEGDPNNQGFDKFYGYNCQRLAHRYYPTHLWDNNEKVLLEGNDWTHKVTYAPDMIQKERIKFIEENKEHPFFAFIPLVLPHAELIAPNDEIFKKYDGKFDEIPHGEENGYTTDYGPDIIKEHYCPQEKPNATYAAMVHRLDNYVGEILQKVKDLGIEDNTVIMFASDNGPHNEGGLKPEFFNSSGGLRGKKRDLYEGGIRTPFVVKWPGKVNPGSTSDHVSAFWDVLPTFAEIAGATITNEIDGISFVPTLLNKTKLQKKHEFLYWEFPAKGGRKAVRKGAWKLVQYNMLKGKPKAVELYNLSLDPSESNNIASNYPTLVKELSSIMENEHHESDLFPWK